jgi:hypothetical protein
MEKKSGENLENEFAPEQGTARWSVVTKATINLLLQRDRWFIPEQSSLKQAFHRAALTSDTGQFMQYLW